MKRDGRMHLCGGDVVVARHAEANIQADALGLRQFLRGLSGGPAFLCLGICTEVSHAEAQRRGGKDNRAIGPLCWLNTGIGRAADGRLEPALVAIAAARFAIWNC